MSVIACFPVALSQVKGLYARHLLWSAVLLSSTALAQVPGVSAQALLMLPELRGTHGRGISGPTQSQLKRVFLDAVEAALERSHLLGASVQSIRRRWQMLTKSKASAGLNWSLAVSPEPTSLEAGCIATLQQMVALMCR